MGGTPKQTIGYWFYWAMCFGWCKGPVDAFLEFRAGDKTAWQGRLTASGRISINKPNLWGGEDNTGGGSGGVVGDMDVMFGEADQMPNDYLISTFGPQQSARRGKFCTVFRGGKFGAFSANPKPVSAKIERILKDWQDDTPWYPEKAVITLDAAGSMPVDSAGWEYQQLPYEADPGHTNLTPPATGWQTDGAGPFSDDNLWTRTPNLSVFWIRKTVSIPGAGLTIHAAADNGCVLFINGELIGTSNPDNSDIPGNQNFPVNFPVPSAGEYEIVVKAYTESTSPTQAGNYLAVSITSQDLRGMNPAHILFDSLTHVDMQGEPVGAINDASFRAAADKLHSEGFGLCTDYDSGQETPKQFQQRICNVIGASLSQSRVDGLYYLDLIRGDYDLDSLPIIGEDDVISFSQDPSVITETGNKLSIEWFDPQKKETRTTAPVFAMGNVQSAGRVIPAETKKYPEIPLESLALRVASRDLKSTSVPLSKFDLGTRATLRALRPGMNARLQLPSEGIADLVVVVGSVAHGTATKGDMKIVGVQNVYSMPSTVYVKPQESLWTPPSSTPVAAPNQRLIESPYVEIVANLSATELGALTSDSAFILALASRPPAGMNYLLTTAAAGEDYEPHDNFDWCPSATIAGSASYLDTDFVLTDASLLGRVELGSWALWDEEIVRIDALDVGAGTVTVGRGCADTVPALHADASRIYFAGSWGGTDSRQYVGGDVVRAKLLTNAGGQLDPALAPELTVTLDDRQVRPYPPGAVKIDSEAYPATVTGIFTVTWAHRNRVTQADQLVDTTGVSMTPVPNTRYALRFLDASNAVLVERTDIGPAMADVVLNYTGDVTLELYTLDNLSTSWQKHQHLFAYTPPAGTVVTAITATPYTPVYDGIIVDGGA